MAVSGVATEKMNHRIKVQKHSRFVFEMPASVLLHLEQGTMIAHLNGCAAFGNRSGVKSRTVLQP
jgi:hypothetical protein